MWDPQALEQCLYLKHFMDYEHDFGDDNTTKAFKKMKGDLLFGLDKDGLFESGVVPRKLKKLVQDAKVALVAGASQVILVAYQSKWKEHKVWPKEFEERVSSIMYGKYDIILNKDEHHEYRAILNVYLSNFNQNLRPDLANALWPVAQRVWEREWNGS